MTVAPLPARPLRLLVFVANPSDLAAMGMDAVALSPLLHTLLPSLAPHTRTGRVRVTLLTGVTALPDELTADLRTAGWTLVQLAASLDNLQRLAVDCDLLYLTAHGRDDGLLLEADGGDAAWADVADVADKLHGAGARPHLLFLAACFSGARTGADAFAALLAPDAAAGQVDLALNRARRLLYARHTPEWTPPVLFCRLHAGRLFAAAPPASGPVLPPPLETLVGRTRFLHELAVALPATPRLALHGPAGIGKTALALANHPAVAAAFPAGRAWVALGPHPDLFTVLKQLATEFGADPAAVQSVDDCAAPGRRVTTDLRWLLVIDDIWAPADALPLLAVCGRAACALMTTRSAPIADDLRAANQEVFVLSPADSVAMLATAGRTESR